MTLCKKPSQDGFFCYIAYSRHLIRALTLLKTEREAQGAEKGSAEHQTKVRSCGCALFFLHQRNEWHNEGTALNVREPSVALPVGLCRRQKGETREEGGHILEMFALCK